MPNFVLVADMVFIQQSARFYIQILAQGVCSHADGNGIGKLRGRACPSWLRCRYKTGNGFQNMIGRLSVQLVFRLFEIPDLRSGILFQIENLILLVAPYRVDGCLQCRALFLLHEKRPVRAAEQSCCTGDHFEAVTGRLLAGVVDSQDTDAVLVGKLLEPTDDLIITGVAVCLAADFPDFLHGVNDNESGIWMFPHEVLKLLVQPVSNLARSGCKVQPVGVVDAVHHEHTALDALKIVLQGKVQHRTGMDFAAPQSFARADMIGDLRHQK